MKRRSVRQTDTLQSQGEQGTPGRHTIRSRLRWSYLISSTLPLLLVGALLIALNLRTQQRSVYTTQETLATQTARDISTYIQNIESQVLRFGLTIGPDTPSDQLETAVNGFVSSNPDIRQITVLDQAGTELIRLPREPLADTGTPGTTPGDQLVRSALSSGQGGRTFIRQLADGQALFTIVLPMRTNGGAIGGALRAEVSAARIAQALRTANDGAGKVAYLVNEQREVMLTDGRLGWNAPANLDELFRADASVAEYLDGTGNNVVGARAQIRPSEWWVIVEQSSVLAFGNVYRSVILLGTLVSVVGLMALAWALFQSRQILQPLNTLREGALTLGAGHLEHRIQVSGNDELSQLAQTFNQMAERLQTSLSKIEQQNEHLRQGLMLARDIQMGLLPTQPPWTYEALTVYGRSVPAYEVGGDFYTYVALPNGQAAVAIGDISGKGVAAALLMALTSSMVESQARQIERPAEILSTLNRLLSPRLRSNRMNAALLFAMFDLQAHTMTVANAGMIAPALVHNARSAPAAAHTPDVLPMPCEFVEVGGLPIGAMPTALYHDVVAPLASGDVVLFVSDGVVEAHNEVGELFGFERLEALINSLHDIEVHRLVDLILHHVQEFMGKAEQHDDITIVAVRPALLEKDETNPWDEAATAEPQTVS